MFTKGLFLLAFIVLLAGPHAAAQFYYGSDGPIPLTIDSFKVAIKFVESDSLAYYKAAIESIARIESELSDDHMIDGFTAYSLSTGDNYNDFLDSLDSMNGVYLVEPYYLFPGIDSPMVVGETFCAAFDTSLSPAQIDSVNASFKVVVDHELYGMPGVYLLRNTDSSGSRVLALANTYHELQEVQFAHPEFGVRSKPCYYRFYDYYHPYQWQIKPVIGWPEGVNVWDFAGLDDPIVVAVLDDGIDSHEDLPADRILPGYDFAYYDNDPRPASHQGHGMACAGIIGASHSTDSMAGLQSSSGIISLDPHVWILPVRKYDDSGVGLTAIRNAEAVTYAWQNGADVISNSWGYFFPYYDSPTLDVALWNAYAHGRNGLGCPVIFAAGNCAQTWPEKVDYPARLPFCFSVGAIDFFGYRWDYSCYGPDLDVVAFSGDTDYRGDVWSLDQMGDLGVNPNLPVLWGWKCPSAEENDVDYDCHFGGTSAACPVASGVAALLLARRPTLTSGEVYYILRNSANTLFPWGPITPPQIEYGYGSVDAYRAMLSIARGDADNSGSVNIADAVYIISFMFKGGPYPQPDFLTGDADCDADVSLADAVYIVNYIFNGGPEPSICFAYEWKDR